jgi:hypothetical protein
LRLTPDQYRKLRQLRSQEAGFGMGIVVQEAEKGLLVTCDEVSGGVIPQPQSPITGKSPSHLTLGFGSLSRTEAFFRAPHDIAHSTALYLVPMSVAGEEPC